MEAKLIAIESFCDCHKIDGSFLESLNEFGLIEIVPVDNNRFLQEHQLQEVERMMRLHYDLEINIAGIDAIAHLLKRMNELQQEITSLKNRL